MILNGVIGKKGLLTFEKRELPFGGTPPSRYATGFMLISDV